MGSPPQKILLASAAPLANRNSWGGNPESLGANRSACYPRDQSLFVYYYTPCNSQENHKI